MVCLGMLHYSLWEMSVSGRTVTSNLKITSSSRLVHSQHRILSEGLVLLHTVNIDDCYYNNYIMHMHYQLTSMWTYMYWYTHIHARACMVVSCISDNWVSLQLDPITTCMWPNIRKEPTLCKMQNTRLYYFSICQHTQTSEAPINEKH